MSKYEDILLKSIQELLKEDKISKLGDIYSSKVKSSPQQQQPPQQQQTQVQQQPLVSPNQILSKKLIDIIIENGNCINLGIFLGLTPQETVNILYNKTTYKTSQLPQDAIARVDQFNNMEINVNNFNYILKYHSSDTKPLKYWYMIYVITHELIHVFTQSRDGQDIGTALDEAIAPIIEYEFFVNYNGATSPHLIDVAENGFIRMHNKKSFTTRVNYSPETFYYFDQFVGLNSLDHKRFINFIRAYTKTNPTTPEKLATVKKYYPAFEEQ